MERRQGIKLTWPIHGLPLNQTERFWYVNPDSPSAYIALRSASRHCRPKKIPTLVTNSRATPTDTIEKSARLHSDVRATAQQVYLGDFVMVTRQWFVGLVAILMLAASFVEVSAQGPGGGRGGRPNFEKLVDAFDANDDGMLEKGEVPPRVWARLLQADANNDGYVTRKEFDSYRP